jgi:Family of unknown function (DUF6600)
MFEKGRYLMKWIQMTTIAILLGAFTPACTISGQSPRYGPPQGPPPGYGDDRGQGDDRGYDDRGYDDRGYDDNRGYDGDRGYDRGYDEYAPRADVGFFYDELSPYGDWVRTRDLGWAWFPRDVHPYWRPYSDGRWVVTEYGWTWVSYEPFGWATYHYGRWAWDPRFGWLWTPGTVWGPAWVSWQYGGGYVGWAPLPPAVGFEIGFGIRLGGFDLNVGIRPNSYSFVAERSFLEPRLSGYVVPSARNVTIIHNTTNITNYTYVDNRVVNRGVDVRRIEQATGQRMQQRHVAAARTRTHSEVARSEVLIYRPERQQLDSVRVGPRADAGQRPEAPRPGRVQDKPAPPGRSVPDFAVAPRAKPSPQPDTRQVATQERRAQQELERYQAEEQRKLGKLHQQELAQARAQADRSQVRQQQQAEVEAMRKGQQNAAQQLAARQQAQRQAVVAKPSGRAPSPGAKPAADSKQKEEKGKDKQKDKKGKDKKKDKGHG